MDVTLDYDEALAMGILRWEPNPVGRVPAKYRIYGSDEKGFAIADQKFRGTAGVTNKETAAGDARCPTNFIAETTATELAVIGREVEAPAANKTYHRVVSVDDQGNRSDPSDCAGARKNRGAQRNEGKEKIAAATNPGKIGDLLHAGPPGSPGLGGCHPLLGSPAPRRYAARRNCPARAFNAE